MKKSTIVSKFKLGLASGVLVSAFLIPITSYAGPVMCGNGLTLADTINGCKVGCGLSGAYIVGMHDSCMESCIYNTSKCPR